LENIRTDKPCFVTLVKTADTVFKCPKILAFTNA
jgi:hypothetical protein